MEVKFKFNYYRIDSNEKEDDDFKINAGYPIRNFFVDIKPHFEKKHAEDSANLINVLLIEDISLLYDAARNFISRVLTELNYFLNDEPPYEPIPLLTVCKENIMIPPKYRDQNFVEHMRNLDPRFRFLDSSIWFRYLSVDNYEANGEGFLSRLETVLKGFDWSYKNGLFYSTVALEHLEYNTRLFEVSKLVEISNGDSTGGHASKITPFIFHSETKMELEANRLRREFAKKKLQWKFLLVDDYGNKHLGTSREKPEGNPSKGDIIQQLINAENELNANPNGHNLIFSTFETKTKINEGISFLENPKERPDVILLDYLFSDATEGTRYGDEFLELLSNPERRQKLKNGKGPFDKFWIFPVSVFSDALLSALQEKGIQYLEQDWLILRGADPINSPYLFRASLYEFLELQYKRIDYSEVDLYYFLGEHVLEDIQSDMDERYGRKWARDVFPIFNQNFSALDSILVHNSGFAESARKYLYNEHGLQENDLDRASGHRYNETIATMQAIRQLIFVMANTTGFDSPIMRRSLQHIKQRYRSLEKDKKVDFEGEIPENIKKTLKNLGIAVLTTHQVYQ